MKWNICGRTLCLQRCVFGMKKHDCVSLNLPLHFLQKLWYTAYEVRTVQFRPFVYDAMDQQVPVVIEPMTLQDAATTTKEPRWQTDWPGEYISKGKFDVYGLKTQIGELVALGAYEIKLPSILSIWRVRHKAIRRFASARNTMALGGL